MFQIRRYFGDKAFYKAMFAVAIPMVIQSGITTFVNLLDNVMVGQLGTLPMSAVTIDNEFMFVFNLMIFGAMAGAGIFTAQFFGKKDIDGVRNTFRFKFLLGMIVSVFSVVFLLLLKEPLIRLFTDSEKNSAEEIAATVGYAKDYIDIIVIGLIPFSLAQVYSTTMREIKKTAPPMVASVIAILTNLILNYILIFGKLGAPALGVRGAAIATVVSRFFEFIFLAVWTHTHSRVYPYIRKAYASMRIPKKLVIEILKKGFPLMANELFWSLGIVVSTKCFSSRGIQVVGAFNISTTIFNLSSIVFMTMGNTISIIVGNQLGAGELDKAQDTAKKMIVFSVLISAAVSGLMIGLSPFLPRLYNTEQAVRDIASFVIRVDGVLMCVYAFTNAAYFTLRSGGKVFVTILFDSFFTWAVYVPVCLILSYLTDLPIQWLYVLAASTEFVKAVLGYIFLRRKTWVNQLVADEELSADQTF